MAVLQFVPGGSGQQSGLNVAEKETDSLVERFHTMTINRIMNVRDEELRAPAKRVIYGFLGVLLVYVIIRSILAAAGKSLWYDELLTLTVSSQGAWHGILSALRGPLDGQPPLFYKIELIASSLIGNQEIALRLPSIFALPCTITCVFIYAKRHMGEIVAIVCAVFFLMTNVFQYYAMEARPYSMVLACIAFALVCYQRVPSPLWTVLLAISLALAESLQYIAVLAIVPLGLAEAVRVLGTRRFRWAVWAALVFGTLPLFLFWKLLALTRAYYGAHFYFAQFPISVIPRTYGEYFLTDGRFGAAVAAVAIAGVLGTAFGIPVAKNEDSNEDPAERVLLCAFVGLPFIGYVFTRFTHSGMTGRYILSTVIGVTLALGYMLSRTTLRAVALFAVFVLSAVAVHELHFWRFMLSDIHDVGSRGGEVKRIIEGAGRKELPVVVPDGGNLLWIVHYAFPTSADRLLYLTQDYSQGQKQWEDTVDKGLRVYATFEPLRVSSFLQFASANEEFLFYTEDQNVGKDWLTMRLIREGWSVQTVAADGVHGLYLATRKGECPSQSPD
jgi:hypothetical protein